MKRVRIVYTGPGLSGATTSVKQLLVRVGAQISNEMGLSFLNGLWTGDLSLFWPWRPHVYELHLLRFTQRPTDLPSLFQEQSHPGEQQRLVQVRAFLEKADGIIYLADSQPERCEVQLRHIEQFRFYWREVGRDPDSVPLVFQLNKRDLPNISTIEQLKQELTWPGAKYVPSIATEGKGVGRALNVLLEQVKRSRES
jgi:hypothetical protein